MREMHKVLTVVCVNVATVPPILNNTKSRTWHSVVNVVLPVKGQSQLGVGIGDDLLEVDVVVVAEDQLAR